MLAQQDWGKLMNDELQTFMQHVQTFSLSNMFQKPVDVSGDNQDKLFCSFDTQRYLQQYMLAEKAFTSEKMCRPNAYLLHKRKVRQQITDANELPKTEKYKITGHL